MVRGYVCILALLWSSLASVAQIRSTFDSDDEGWTALDNQAGPTPAYSATGGNPGGYVSVVDGVAGTATFFVAPAKFLGNRAAYYDGTLTFDLQVSVAPNSNTAGVRLTGDGLVLAKLVAPTVSGLPAVAPNWSSYSFQLNEAGDWRLNNPATGNVATAAQVQRVLSNLTEIAINGEYNTATADGGGLDNVVMTPGMQPGITIYNALSPNGDGDNDIFYIENIQARVDTQQNKVSIYNRWGDLVWDGTNYDNDGVVFKGISKTGKKVLAGTYYYVIEFLGGRKTETGFLSIRY